MRDAARRSFAVARRPIGFFWKLDRTGLPARRGRVGILYPGHAPISFRELAIVRDQIGDGTLIRHPVEPICLFQIERCIGHAYQRRHRRGGDIRVADL